MQSHPPAPQFASWQVMSHRAAPPGIAPSEIVSPKAMSSGIVSLRNRFVGCLVGFHHRERTDLRGLSQSTENAILLTGAVALAITVVGLVTAFVKGKLENLG